MVSTAWEYRQRGFAGMTIALAVALATAAAAARPALAEPSAPILLTFDVEEPSDAEALRQIKPDVPATYFVTGEFLEAYPDLVRSLKQGNTIGSHTFSHPDLATLDDQALTVELKLARYIHEAILGTPPRWFRAPYLKFDQRIETQLAHLGFAYDSSASERWPLSRNLPQLPISGGLVLASDYDIFEKLRFSEPQALEWLKQEFLARRKVGRPLVLLLHPRLILPHRAVLDDFIAFAREQGGSFLSADGYVESLLAARQTARAVWIDLQEGKVEPATLVADLQGAGITDAFLLARGTEGIDYVSRQATDTDKDQFGTLVQMLRAAGLRVHAWIPANYNTGLAAQHPDWSMVSSGGDRSESWISPLNPQARAHLLETVKSMVERYPVDGVHLDYLRFPSLDYDFSDQAVRAFAAETGVTELDPGDILSRHYVSWTDWRGRVIADLVKDVRSAVGDSILLSAALIADVAVSGLSFETYGQDYSALAESLNLIIPMAYYHEDMQDPRWISNVILQSRFRIGAAKLWVGLEGYQKPGTWRIEAEEFQRAVALAKAGSEGVAVYEYRYLFGRAEEARNMPAGSAAILAATPADRAWPVGAHRGVAPAGRGGPAYDADDILDPTMLTYVVFGGLSLFFLGSGYGLLQLVEIRSRSRGTVDRLAASNHTDAAAIRALVLDPGPADPERIHQALARLSSAEIERQRVLLVLWLSETAETYAEFFRLADQRNIGPVVARCLNEALLQGYIVAASDRLMMTDAGRNALETAKLDSEYDPEHWLRVESHLREVLSIQCGQCGKDNRTQSFVTDFPCSHCGAPVVLQMNGTDSCKPMAAAAPR